jgi:hypothetical protein
MAVDAIVDAVMVMGVATVLMDVSIDFSEVLTFYNT